MIAAALLLMPFSALAQAPPVEGTNFKVGDLFDSPNQRQIRSLIEGARWRSQGAQTVVYDAKVQKFLPNGAVELIIEAPECFYDKNLKAINSSGPVQFRTADGRFFLSGVGFLWLQTNSTLYISNQVKTVVLPEFIEAGTAVAPTNLPAEAAKGVTVFSDRFEYARDSGIGIYSGNVHAVGTNVNLKARSDVMEVLVPVGEHQLQTITMKEKVALDYENVEATGEKAVYTAATGLAKITGSPAWHDANQRQGRGDELVIDRTNRTFRANGQGWVKMPTQSMGANGFLSSATSSAPGTNQFVEIFSDNYEFRTNSIGNSAQFGDHVRMVDTSNGQTNGTLTSATMLVTLLSTNALQSMVAEKNVVIERGDNQFMGQKAVYSATNSILELTGDPTWRAGDRDGKGETILVDLKRSKMDVLTNAYMRVPASQLGPSTAMKQASGDSSSPRQTPTKAGDAGKNEMTPVISTKEKVEGNFSSLPLLPEGRPKTKLPPKHDTQPSPPQYAEIFSERYTVTTNTAGSRARFEGGVRIVHPRLNWVCRTMDVDSPNPKDVTMIAEQAVEFTLRSATDDENAQSAHGTCNRAVYNYAITPNGTNDTMTLTGNPILETTNGIIKNRILILDCANNKLMAPGPYKIYGTNSTPIPTNAFQFPSGKKKK
jgi:lipopolysaccharide export system protein LptA